MADSDSKYAQHMDKIAYAVAGVVGLIVLAIPLLFGGQVKPVVSLLIVTLYAFAISKHISQEILDVRVARNRQWQKALISG